MAKFTTAEYFEKWDEVRKSFREDPDRTVVLIFKLGLVKYCT